MLTLDLTNAPRWHDLVPGVRVQLRPLTTALMVATRSDPAIEAVPENASDEERAVAFAAYSLDDQMAKTPEAAIKLMTDMVPAATASTTAAGGSCGARS